MRFIKTEIDGDRVAYNSANIKSIQGWDDGCHIEFNDGVFLKVTETYEEVLEGLEKE